MGCMVGRRLYSWYVTIIGRHCTAVFIHGIVVGIHDIVVVIHYIFDVINGILVINDVSVAHVML